MQKIGGCGEEQFTPVTLSNQEKPVEEEVRFFLEYFHGAVFPHNVVRT